MRVIPFLLSLFVCLISCQDNKSVSKKNEKQTEVNVPSQQPLLKKKEKKKKRLAKITNKNVVDTLAKYGVLHPETQVKLSTKFGDIEIELSNETPLHRANFINIVKTGFLSETCFYRVAKGFVIQGGNSDRSSMARIKNRIGSGFTIPAEFRKNLKHNYGAVAMARIYKHNPHKRSSPFEFYIVVNPKGAHHLNNEHTIIGRVTKGMDVAKKINLEKVDFSEWPENDIYMKASIIK